jgi:hypothetical protein
VIQTTGLILEDEDYYYVEIKGVPEGELPSDAVFIPADAYNLSGFGSIFKKVKKVIKKVGKVAKKVTKKVAKGIGKGLKKVAKGSASLLPMIAGGGAGGLLSMLTGAGVPADAAQGMASALAAGLPAGSSQAQLYDVAQLAAGKYTAAAGAAAADTSKEGLGTGAKVAIGGAAVVGAGLLLLIAAKAGRK